MLLNATIPILGFIGTVLGLGQAVGGFSEFLAGEVELDQIKEALRVVTGGLSTAFDTTLLALVLNLLMSFPLSSIQRKEEEFLVEMDVYVDDHLIARFPPPEEKPIVLENLEDAIEAAFRRYIPDPDRYDEVFTRAIERAARSVEERFANLSRDYETSLRDLSGRLAESMATAGTSFETSMKQVADDVHEQEQSLISSRRTIAQEESDRLRKMLSEVQESAQRVASEYQASAAQLESTTRDSARQSLEAAQSLSDRMTSITQMASAIEDLLHIEQSIHKGLDGISASDEFRRTLTNLREHLETTDAFCKRLSKPKVITLREEVAGA
jgi:hypothetical protein